MKEKCVIKTVVISYVLLMVLVSTLMIIFNHRAKQNVLKETNDSINVKQPYIVDSVVDNYEYYIPYEKYTHTIEFNGIKFLRTPSVNKKKSDTLDTMIAIFNGKELDKLDTLLIIYGRSK